MENQIEPDTGQHVSPIAPADEPAGPFEIRISEDRMAATLCIRNVPDSSRDEMAARIQAMLAEKKIVAGIDENEIERCLAKLSSDGPREYVIARGLPPTAGQDASILLKFTGERKVGTMDEYAKMDFRERGTNVYVKEGDLLAVKVPMVKGEPGTTVTGQPIPTAPVQDVSLKAGRNTRAVDGLRLEAKICGLVRANKEGAIEVDPVFLVEGDVDLSVGHINFDGPVQVSGVIRSGFRVRAASLTAGFVEHDTKIEVKSDVTVREGLIGAQVKTGGILKCGYIRGSRVIAEGDVEADTEIVDSHISSLGTVVVKRENGRIMNSAVIARGGLETCNLGSDSSPACEVTIGWDYRSDAKIQAVNDEILQCDQNLQKLEEKFEQIGGTKQYLEKSLEDIKRKLPAAKDTRQKYRLHKQYQDLSARFKELNKNYTLLLDAIVSFRGRKGDLDKDRQALAEEAKRVEPETYLIVRGTIAEGTKIRGKTALLEAPNTIDAVRAHETISQRELENGRMQRSVEIELLAL